MTRSSVLAGLFFFVATVACGPSLPSSDGPSRKCPAPGSVVPLARLINESFAHDYLGCDVAVRVRLYSTQGHCPLPNHLGIWVIDEHSRTDHKAFCIPKEVGVALKEPAGAMLIREENRAKKKDVFSEQPPEQDRVVDRVVAPGDALLVRGGNGGKFGKLWWFKVDRILND